MNKSDNKSFEFCKLSLEKVSRTFYLNTVRLRQPILNHVMVAYLFCRIADTIEDDPKITNQEKADGLQMFKDLLWTTKDLEFSNWLKFCKKLKPTKEEEELCINIDKVFDLFLTFPASVQEVLKKHIDILVEGMFKYSINQKDNKLNQIKDFSDFDQYCYYVAGVVGELLSCTFTLDCPSVKKEKIHKYAVNFGLGLQYVNIIKDIFKDKKRSWCYYPKSLFYKHNLKVDDFFDTKFETDKKEIIINEMIEKAKIKLDDAFSYILNLPRREYTVRLFCLWPLFFALETLKKVSENKDKLLQGEIVKINRKIVKSVILKTSLLVFSNTLLKFYYKKYK